MLSVQQASNPKARLGGEHSPASPLRNSLGALSPPPSPRPMSGNLAVPPSPRFGGEGLDRWFEDLQKYEATLGAMALASEEPKFREELGTIEQWFKLLSESEQTATLYTLLQHANQGQVKFLSAVLSQMSDSANTPADNATKVKQAPRNLRPPSLNLPLPGSPATPQFTPATPANDKLASRSQLGQIPESQDVVVKPSEENSWASMVNTPLDKMFTKSSTPTNGAAMASPSMGMPGLMNMAPYNMAMLNNMGFSSEAQLLAVQMVMSGLIQPAVNVMEQQQQQQQSQSQHHQKQHHGQAKNSNTSQKSHWHSSGNNWRAPPSAKYPGSALRSGALKSAGPRSGGLRSAGLKSASSVMSGTTPKEDDIDPELLEDVPAWLKSLRLHKYTACFEGMTWKEMVVLDEPKLEAMGIAALGARRRLTKTFDLVKKKMGMESSSSDTAETSSAVPASAALPHTNGLTSAATTSEFTVPHSAAPTLSI